MDERERILSILREALPQLSERFKARRLALFGSVAHGECGEHSDVDLLVEFEPGASLFDLVAMGGFLEGRLGRRVDLSTPNALHPAIKAQVLADIVPV